MTHFDSHIVLHYRKYPIAAHCRKLNGCWMLRDMKIIVCAVAAMTIGPTLAFAASSSVDDANAARKAQELTNAVQAPNVPIQIAQAAPAPPPSGAQGKAIGKTVTPVDRTETWINDLHKSLRITKDQEPLWNDVAQAMRDEASATDAFFKDRAARVNTMTAVDDLNAYQAFTQERADRLKKVATAFQTLYDSMPADQKKNADTVFKNFHHRGTRSAKPKSD